MKLNEGISSIANIATAVLSSTSDEKERWEILQDLLAATSELNASSLFPPYNGNIPESELNELVRMLITNQQIRVSDKYGNQEVSASIREEEANRKR